MARYKGDPRWVTVRYTAKCRGCGAEIPPTQEAFYFPNTKNFFGKGCGCGDHESRQFEAQASDDDFNRCL